MIHIRLGRIKIRVLDEDATHVPQDTTMFAKSPFSDLRPYSPPLPVPERAPLCLYFPRYIRVSSMD